MGDYQIKLRNMRRFSEGRQGEGQHPLLRPRDGAHRTGREMVKKIEADILATRS